MTNLDRFVEYATEFEKTFGDDDWTRLERFFHPDATYEVRGISFGCRLEGRPTILRGIRRSLDGFDRRCDSRDIDLTDPPEERDGVVTLGWKGTYTRGDAPPVTLRGRSRARYEDGVIVELSDTYEPEAAAQIEAWLKQHGGGLDPSYA